MDNQRKSKPISRINTPVIMREAVQSITANTINVNAQQLSFASAVKEIVSKNNSAQDKKKDIITLIRKKPQFILCCDPNSLQVYSLNLQTQDIHVEVSVPHGYRSRVEEGVKQIQNIVALPGSQWQFHTYQVWAYRRRHLNEYLIRRTTNVHPTYLAQSPMSDAFANVSSLKLLVDVSEYVYLEESNLEFKNMNPLVLEFHIDLVTCADEVVKKVIRQIYHVFGVRVKPHYPENKFLLQISGFREFLAGNYPLLSYDRVRASLRGIQFLKVALTEVISVVKGMNFPPIFERDLDEILRGSYSPINWEDLTEVPVFYYYPPYPLPMYNKLTQPPPESKRSSKSNNGQPNFDVVTTISDIVIIQNYNYIIQQSPSAPKIIRVEIQHQPLKIEKDNFIQFDDMNSSSVSQNKRQLSASQGLKTGIIDHSVLGRFHHVTNENDNERLMQQAQNQKEFVPLRPRVLIKQKAIDFNELRMKMIDKGNFNLDSYTIYSGECDFPFRVQIVGLTNIFRLLILDDKKHEELATQPKRRATYNGICPPRYLTKASAQQEEQHNTSKKKVKVERDPNEVKKKRFLKFTKISKAPQEVTFTPHLDHGSQCSRMLEQLAQRYELDLAPYQIHVQVSLMYGQTTLTKSSMTHTRRVPFRKMARWDQVLEFNGLKISQLPMESAENSEQVIGCVMMDVFDPNGMLRQGRTTLNVWPFYRFDNRLACMGEYNGVPFKGVEDKDYYSKIIIALDQFDAPLQWSLRSPLIMSKLGFFKSPKGIQQLQFQQKEEDKHVKFQTVYDREPEWTEVPTIAELASLQELIVVDPLNRVNFTVADKLILMKCRKHYKSMGKYFAVFLTSIDWSDPQQIQEVYQYIPQWEPLHPNEALPLLDATISDEAIRFYATERVGSYRDDELVLYMLELTQALMFEQQHFSPLGEMLLERGIMNPWFVGHELFWQLRSQLHLQPSYERYSLMLEEYFRYRSELLKEVQVNDAIMLIAESVKNNPEKNRLVLMRNDLEKIRSEFDQQFQFAIDPRMACSEFVNSSCRILDSKKLPLMLRMKGIQIESKHKGRIVVQVSKVPDIEKLRETKMRMEFNAAVKSNDGFMIIYKCGDDIRQDLLTLQLIKIMDKIWLDFGMDFRMKPYRVISTLDQVGMIEVVLNSQTISDIHKQAGSLGAFQKDSINDYILRYNKNDMENAIENFVRSCAGYCVATYVLGIGDRHSGNIMVTEMGHFFHIDFGHFLGNFKTKFGFNRERTPFVFTQEMAYVFEAAGEEKKLFKKFKTFSCEAYNQVRKNGHFLINIFLMMLSAGMPELQELSDIDYLKNQLSLDLSEQEATEKFLKEIEMALLDTWRSIDNLIHNLKRK